MGSPVVQIDAKKIAPSRDYIRTGKGQGVRDELVAEYTEAMRTYGGWGSFPPVEVVAYASPQKGAKGQTFTHELIDGMHRVEAARRCGMDKVPAIVSPLARDGDLYLRQYEANKHGLRLDRREVQNALQRLVTHYGFERKRVQEISGYSKSTIDRIVKGQELKTAPRKKPKKATKKPKKVASQMPRPDAKVTPADFLKAVQLLVRSFAGNREAILAEYRKTPKPWETTLTGLGGMAGAFAKAGG